MKTKLFLIVMMIIATTCGIKAQNDSIALATAPQIDSNSEDHPGGWDFSLPFMNSSREKEYANTVHPIHTVRRSSSDSFRVWTRLQASISTWGSRSNSSYATWWPSPLV